MFSIDTNIVLGIVNPHDRLHKKSIEVIHDEIKENKLILFNFVVTESQTTFSKKYNTSLAKVFKMFTEVDRMTPDKMERIHLFWDKFRELKQENHNLLNFMNLIYDKITPFVTKWDIFGAYRMLSAYGLIASNNIQKILCEEAENKIEFFAAMLKINKNILNEMETIKSSITSQKVKFNDEGDESIFIEVVLYSIHEKETLKFYSNDKEFMNKSNIVFNKISEDTNYSYTKIDFILLKS